MIPAGMVDEAGGWKEAVEAAIRHDARRVVPLHAIYDAMVGSHLVTPYHLEPWRPGKQPRYECAIRRILTTLVHEGSVARVGRGQYSLVSDAGPGRKYVIEPDGRLWVLRRFGRQETLASGATAEDVREQAFGRLKDFAPLERVIVRTAVGGREEWRLANMDAKWQERILRDGA